jgi:hypothetical protein
MNTHLFFIIDHLSRGKKRILMDSLEPFGWILEQIHLTVSNQILSKIIRVRKRSITSTAIR